MCAVGWFLCGCSYIVTPESQESRLVCGAQLGVTSMSDECSMWYKEYLLIYPNHEMFSYVTQQF